MTPKNNTLTPYAPSTRRGIRAGDEGARSRHLEVRQQRRLEQQPPLPEFVARGEQSVLNPRCGPANPLFTADSKTILFAGTQHYQIANSRVASGDAASHKG